MKRLKLFFLITSILLLASCSRQEQGGENVQPPSEIAEDSGEEEKKEILLSEQPNQKTIDNTAIMMSVEDLDGADSKLHELLAKYKGILISSNLSRSGEYQRRGKYQFKILPEENDAFYKEAKTLGEIESESRSSDDVTKQHTDTEIRLKSLKTQYDRLNELLAEASTMNDLITLEEKIRENIIQQEEIQAQLDALNSNVNYINYSLDFYETASPVPEVEKGFGNRVIRAFQSTGIWFINVIQTLVLVLIYLLPYILVALIAVFIFRKYRKKHPRARKEKNQSFTINRWKKKEDTEDENRKS